MNIRHCDIHGTWRSEFWDKCPDCICDMVEKEYNERRKTFLGRTAVSWFLFSYIAIVLIAMAWIVISHVPEAR